MAHIFQTPSMGRKGSYVLSDGRSSATPVNVDVLNDNSGQKILFEPSKGKSQGTGDPENGRRAAKKKATILLFIAMIVVIILLIAAIIWLLTARNGKAIPQDSEGSEQSARKADVPASETTTRTTRVIDPGTKPSRSTTISSSAATTSRTTTTTPSTVDYEEETERKSGNVPLWKDPNENLTTYDPVSSPEEAEAETEFFSSSTELTQTEMTTSPGAFTPMIETESTHDLILEGSGTFETEVSTTSFTPTQETTTENDIVVVYDPSESETAISDYATEHSSPVTSSADTSSTYDFTSTQPATTEKAPHEGEGSSSKTDGDDLDKLSSFTASSTSTTVNSSEHSTVTTAEYDDTFTRDEKSTTQLPSSTKESSFDLEKDVDYASPIEGSGSDEVTWSTSSTETTPVSRLGVAEVDRTGFTVTEERDYTTAEELIISVSSSTTAPDPPSEQICWTEECQVLASQMRSVMNVNENPCENFYQYSCGKIGSKSSLFQTLPIDPVQDVNRRIGQALRQIDSNSRRPLKVFQTFYKQCLSGANEPLDHKIELVRNAVHEIGQFETGENYNSSSFDLTRLIGELILRHSSPVFDVILDVDKQNTSRFAFKVGPWQNHGSFLGHITFEVEYCMSLAQPNSTSDEAIMLDDLYSNYVNCLEDLNLRLNRMEEALETLGFFTDMEKTQRRQLVSALRFSAEYDILQPVKDEKPSAAEFRQALLAKQYTEYTVRDMYKQFPGIDWKRLFFILTKEDVPEEEIVQVYFSSYLKKKLRPVTKVNSDSYKIQNVLLALYASDLFHDLAHFERHTEQGCQELAVNWMEDVASTLYLSTFKAEELRSTTETLSGMFKDLKETLVKQIHSVSWEDPTLSTTLLSKAQAVTADFENSVYLLKHPDVLDSRWHSFQLGQDFVDSSLKLLKRYRRSLYVMKGADPGSKESIWSLFSLPTVTAGRTMYALNRILIPLGSTASGQLLNSKFPMYVNMGKIGTLMAHEIMHTFDPAGIQFSPGSVSIRDASQYSQTFSCMASRTKTRDFISAKDKYVSFDINNELTMNERYSDAAGLALALEAYRQRKDREEFKTQIQLLPYLNMTDSQLFFVSTAQVFCTLKGLEESAIDVAEREHLHSELRVRELVRNSAEFREAFLCQQKPSKLTEEPPCPVFPFLHR